MKRNKGNYKDLKINKNSKKHHFSRYLTEKKLKHESWFLYYPEEGNTRGAPTQLLRFRFKIRVKKIPQ